MQQEKENKGNMPITPLISVIVPIYNVERYVRKCLDSLKGQTLREIEVICIDDGSTDRSGEIADEYESSEFPIFRVIHTENRGLSAARNRGLDEARAEWIMFVDSDDWVDSRFCELPWKASLEYEADLVIYSNWRTSESGRTKREKTRNIRLGIVDHDDVILNSAAWNKLYSKKLFDDVRYPEGQLFEDKATTHKLTGKARRIYRCNDRLYYYRKRKDSITTTISKSIDAYIAGRQRYQDLMSMGYPAKIATTSLQAEALNYCGHAPNMKDPLYCEAEEIVKQIIGIPEFFDRKSKVKLMIWRTNKNLYRAMYRWIGKQIR